MSRDEILNIAREAGFVIDDVARQNQPNCITHTYWMIDEPLTRFAALVASAEREACAKVCEEASRPHEGEMHSDGQWAGLCLAVAIRARSKT